MTSGAPPGNPREIHAVFRQLFKSLRVVGRAEKIPLEYLVEALILIVISRRDTFTRVRPEAIEDINNRRFGSEVASAAKKQYREDLLADRRDRRKLARRAAPRPTEAASAGVASPVGDPVPAAASVGSAARSRGGPAPSGRRKGLARKRRRDGDR